MEQTFLSAIEFARDNLTLVVAASIYLLGFLIYFEKVVNAWLEEWHEQSRRERRFTEIGPSIRHWLEALLSGAVISVFWPFALVVQGWLFCKRTLTKSR